MEVTIDMRDSKERLHGMRSEVNCSYCTFRRRVIDTNDR